MPRRSVPDGGAFFYELGIGVIPLNSLRSRWGVAAVVVAAMLTLNAQPAFARPSDDRIARLDVVGQVTADESAALQAVHRVVGQGDAGSKMSLPAQAGQIASPLDRPSLAITPRLHGSNRAVKSGTTVLLGDSVTSLKVAVQPLKGGVQLLSVLKDSQTPSTTTYDVTLPSGAEMRLDNLGGVVVRENSIMTSRFSAPWAIDATGRSLPTHYTLSGNALAQVVDTRNATFPVVADPKWIWDWADTGYYFNRSETADLAVYSGAAAAFAAFAPPPFDVVLVIYGVVLSAKAAVANNHLHCVWINAAGAPYEYWGTAGQGYCR